MLPEDIARILEIDFREFKEQLTDERSSEYRRFWKGLLTTEVAIRERANSNAKDIEAIEFDLRDLNLFKAKLNQQLYA